MHTKYQFSLDFDFNHEAILTRWFWFRDQLIAIYQLENIPNIFTPDEGEIQEHHARPDDEMYPPEFNYYWRQQTLLLADKKVKVVINKDDYYCYYSFSYLGIDAIEEVEFFVSGKKQYLAINTANPFHDKWKDIITIIQ